MPLVTPNSPAFTTFTLFQYPSRNRWWAFQQMGLAPRLLAQASGLQFGKLMGMGKGLVFSLWPDWSRYALLATWADAEMAHAFLRHSPLMHAFREKTSECWTIFLHPVKAHGQWDDVNPFPALATPLTDEEPLAVLTRASIRPRSLWPFWQNAPRSADGLQQAEGLLFACGAGELPFVRQATLSLWKNSLAMKEFAYRGRQHQETMRRKQAGHWYSEELFARFRIVGSEGTYQGTNPLADHLPILSARLPT